MAPSAFNLLLAACFFSSLSAAASPVRGQFTPPKLAPLTGLFPHLTFNSSYREFFGGPNIRYSSNGLQVDLSLNNYSGSGFSSQNYFYYGFFSSAMKLPKDYSAGVVVASYMTNADAFPHNHDEIDFELLGHEKGKQWVLQTNVYGNGGTTGREEKFYLWFDPTEEFHEYSTIWNNHHIVFLVDNVPVREVIHNEAIGGGYPSKPMSVYATIWDGSQWATHGGKKPVDYKFAPFTASFAGLEMKGCIWNRAKPPSSCSRGSQELQSDPINGAEFASLSLQQKMGMQQIRKKFMFYSYCADTARYSVLPPECRGTKAGQSQSPFYGQNGQMEDAELLPAMSKVFGYGGKT